MEIIELLKEEETKLQTQLTAIQGAIAALNGLGETTASRIRATRANAPNGKRIYENRWPAGSILNTSRFGPSN